MMGTHDIDYQEKVEEIGGRIRYVIDGLTKLPMIMMKKMMLDMHPDIDCFIKGVKQRDTGPRVDDSLVELTWDEMTGKYDGSFFVDDYFKVVNTDGVILSNKDMKESNIVLPVYCQMINDDDAPCPVVASTDPLFFDKNN